MTRTFDIDYVLANISDQDKIALLSGLTSLGIDFWHTHPIPEFDVPSVRVTDGPNGIRGTKFFAGIPAACLPCGTALGAIWDRELLQRAGELIGDECIAKGAHCWLGPTVNMQRSPLGGRGFESFSEDPYLAGVSAASMIIGCESKGIIATVKHFVGNDQEHERRAVDVLVTPRALREIYLRPFQIVARDARPGALMTSYNKVNGKHVVENPEFYDLIRKDWGWDPLVMSDWYGTYTTIDSTNAGLDLEMPGVSRYRGKYIESAIQARLIKSSTLDARARKVLEFVQRASRTRVSEVEKGRDHPGDRALMRTLCASSIVLLKNEGGILPIPKTVKKIALIGSHIKTPAISGGGSAALKPYYASALYDAVCEALPDVEIMYETGANAYNMLPVIDRLLSNAVIHFYNEPMTVSNRKCLGTEPIATSSWQFMDYKLAGLNRALFWSTMIGDFTPDASGVWDFGLTVFGTANLYIDDELIIDNTTNQTKGTAFFGKGTIEEKGSKELVAGQTYIIRIEFGSGNTTTMKTTGMVNFGGGAANLGASLRMDPQEMINRAVKAAANSDYAIVCTGLNQDWESEGFDRPHMDLPPGIDEMISRVLDVVADRTIIVNQSGTPVTMPWISQARSVVHAWYGGNETGHGIADVLFGEVNPSGKLSLSWPVDVKHNPAYLNYASVGGRILYGEDIYVGYRFYERTGRQTLFPFGHGLSYTTFVISSEASIFPETFRPENPPTATVLVKNTGKSAGAEVLQLYVAAPNSPTPRPQKELHGFEKVFLQPGEETVVVITMDKYATSFWDEVEEMWKSEAGVYESLDSLRCVSIDLEAWGSKILESVERQERLLTETLGGAVSPSTLPQLPPTTFFPSPIESHDTELISRNDTLKTPITGSDMILSWPIFPQEKPVSTFPPAAFEEKPDRFPTAIPSFEPRRILELRDIFMTKILAKNPIIDAEQLEEYIARVLETGIDWSAPSCLVLLVLALAAIWGTYPEDETREVQYPEPTFGAPMTYMTISVPEHRMKESLGYLAMARKRISAAYLDNSLLGVQCLCLFGFWYQYNIEPIPGWKMFRTASMLWQTYNMKHKSGNAERTAQEESDEVRYELYELPPSDLSLSDFPFALPSFPIYQIPYGDSPEHNPHSPSGPALDSTPYYYYLAEISMRRLLNRVRNTVRLLSPSLDITTIKQISATLSHLEDQLHQWVICLPPPLRFNMPLESRPPLQEPELVKLVRERYVEVRELLCRAYLYLCIHTSLDRETAAMYGTKATESLLLAVYRIKNEVPFFRHPGSWGACRVRFNHALCLIAAFRAKVDEIPSAEYVSLPASWAGCVRVVIERLKIWGQEGGGIKELSILLDWLMQGIV
ncbi:glycosyl hydrolase family 3 N terminal domain-containing protein [Aspergillus filifer]